MSDKLEDLNAMETIAVSVKAGEYKDVIVNMYGVDGNAFAIIGAVQKALLRARAPKNVISLFLKEVVSGDYENVIRTCSEWVTVVNVQPRDSSVSALAAFDKFGINVKGY